jgi:hypothetical protein
VIEVTKEMVQEIYSRINFVDHDDSGIAEGLAAVFAKVEQEYAIGPRACCEPAPGEPFAYCELAEGHKGKHSATVEKAVDW